MGLCSSPIDGGARGVRGVRNQLRMREKRVPAENGPADDSGARARPRSTKLRRPSLDERYEHLYRELWRPARAMVRRAFGNAFSDEEIEDVYGNAWLGTLRALRTRAVSMDDAELRKYLLAAVANHASKERRRRGRRPTTSLDDAKSVADATPGPDERAAQNEQSQVARDVLGTLPTRRRAVLLFRYGWGLEPKQVCGLVNGLSPRAYRKEITRGVDEVATKLRMVEDGSWCSDREPLLRAYVADAVDAEEQMQAEHHLAHCRHCADFVARLNQHLHEIGGAIAWVAVADAIDGGPTIADRVAAVGDRVRDTLTTMPSQDDAATGALVSTGGPRGAGAGAAGLMAKFAGLGAAGKLAAACVGTGIAATACVAAGVLPGVNVGHSNGADSAHAGSHASHPALSGAQARVGASVADAVDPDPEPSTPSRSNADGASGDSEPRADAATSMVSPAAPAAEQEFGTAVATGGTGGGGGVGSGVGASASREFGP